MSIENAINFPRILDVENTNSTEFQHGRSHVPYISFAKSWASFFMIRSLVRSVHFLPKLLRSGNLKVIES